MSTTLIRRSVAQETIQIISDPGNPSVPDLLDSFGRAYEPQPHYVTFRVTSERGTISLRISYLTYESGASGMLMIEGYSATEKASFKGFYNANTKSGNLHHKQ